MELKGVFSVLPTPFSQDGNLDLVSLRKALEQIMRERTAWSHLFNFDSYSLGFKASDDNRQTAATA